MSGQAQYEVYVRRLEAFGHRGSATDHEHRAAAYLEDELRAIGLEPVTDPFRGSRSWASRLLIHVVVASIGACLLWSYPAVTIVCGIVALTSMWAEETTRYTLLSVVLPRPTSYNISATIKPTRTAARRLIVVAHYDTQKTGFMWAISRFITPVATWLPVALKPPFLSVQLTFMFQVVVGGLALAGAWHTFLRAAGTSLVVLYTFYIVMLSNWHAGKSVPGAADNASGTAAVLSIGVECAKHPCVNTEVLVLLTGCEETGVLGAAAWLDQHKAQVAEMPTSFLNIDGIGMGPPRFLGWDVPVIGFPRRYPPEMVNSAAEIAARLKLIDAGPHALPGPTDGLAFLARRIPGITVVGFRDGKDLPNYHQMSDTSANIDFRVAWAGVEFARALVLQFSN